MTGKKFLSQDITDAKPCKLKVINNSEADLIFCWVHFSGKLYNFYPINNGSIADGSVKNVHIECTTVGHAFVGFRLQTHGCSRKRKGLPNTIHEVTAQECVFFYRPERGYRMHELEVRSQRPVKIVLKSRDIRQQYSKARVVDSTSKPYATTEICGFTIKYEEGLFEDPELSAFRPTFTADLEQVRGLLASRYAVPLALLQESTIIWVNRSLVYGEGVQGRACCHHPHNGQGWLRSMGCHPEKAGGIEIYRASDYLADRGLWGPGGILMHELAHSYHNQHVANGYQNRAVLDAYTAAMERHLYDRVDVHGRQGLAGPIKAYACANCMEFFAELSTAYMWASGGLADDIGAEGDETSAAATDGVVEEEQEEEAAAVLEYNKWFPFNRRQLRVHDPDSYRVLHGLWSQTEAAVRNARRVVE